MAVVFSTENCFWVDKKGLQEIIKWFKDLIAHLKGLGLASSLQLHGCNPCETIDELLASGIQTYNTDKEEEAF